MQVTLTHLPDTAAEFEALSRRTPEEVCACAAIFSGQYLRPVLEKSRRVEYTD